MSWLNDDSGSDAASAYLLGCLTGLLVGSIAGVLMTPYRGRVARRKLRRRADKARAQVSRTVDEFTS